MSFSEGDVLRRGIVATGSLFFHYGIFIGDGHVLGLSDNGKVKRENIHISTFSWKKVQSGNSKVSDYAKTKENTIYSYSLSSFNCEDFAEECLKAGGLYRTWMSQGQSAVKNTIGTTHVVGGTAFALAAAAATGPFAPIGFLLGGFLAMNGARLVAKK